VDEIGVRRPSSALLDLARAALQEDVGRGDVTSRVTVAEESAARARFVARETLVVSGLEPARAVFFEAGGEKVSFAVLANGCPRS
jgi:nicotinate-nucleotide pyrophosphorylase (carboxylating)